MSTQSLGTTLFGTLAQAIRVSSGTTVVSLDRPCGTGCMCTAAPLGVWPGTPIPEQSRFNKAAAITAYQKNIGVSSS